MYELISLTNKTYYINSPSKVGLFKINDKDNVAVALDELKKGEIIDNIKLLDDIPFGHKVLLNDLKKAKNY